MKKLLLFLVFANLGIIALNAQTIEQIYLEAIKSKFPKFEKSIKKNNGVFIDGKIVTLIINSNGNMIDGTISPTVLKESDQYRYRLVLLTTKDDDTDYEIKISGKEYNPQNEFTVVHTDKVDDTEKVAKITDIVKIYSSDTSDVFSEKVFFKVKKKLDDNSTDVFNWEIKLTSSSSHHAAIMGGYFHTFLNNPSNIIKAPLSNLSDSTLIGDFTNYQRKVTIMAVFYPWERPSDYKWKELKPYERFSVGFGIGLDEDLFDDIFLGLNFEFARGGFISGGVHYGKHNVLATNSDFDYGTDVWNGTFENSFIKEEWVPTYYIGVIIDLRVISSLIITRDNLNKNKED